MFGDNILVRFFCEESYLVQMYKSTQQSFGKQSDLPLIPFLVLLLILCLVANLIIRSFIKNDHPVRTGRKPSQTGLFFLVFIGLLALPFYLIKRPKGTIVICFHCGKMKLKELPSCFFCGKGDVDYVHHPELLHGRNVKHGEPKNPHHPEHHYSHPHPPGSGSRPH